MNDKRTSRNYLLLALAGGLIWTGAATAQVYTWTDGYQGAFASWLESQRLVNTQTATLVLMIDTAESTGMADIFFEDSEGTGSTYGCTDALAEPGLLVSSTIQQTFLFLPMLNRW